MLKAVNNPLYSKLCRHNRLVSQSIAREQFVLIFIMSIPNSITYLIPYWVMVGPGLLVWRHLALLYECVRRLISYLTVWLSQGKLLVDLDHLVEYELIYVAVLMAFLHASQFSFTLLGGSEVRNFVWISDITDFKLLMLPFDKVLYFSRQRLITYIS